MKRITCAVIVTLFAILQPASLFSSGLSDAGVSKKQLASFLQTLQAAVAADDRAAVAKLVRFPLVASDEKHSIYMEGPSQFVKVYPQVFGPTLKRVIADASADNIAADFHGVMISADKVWLRIVDDELKIVAVSAIDAPVQEKKDNATAPTLRIHPEVFSMISCWISDTATPVVTEINLDAVRRNGNQFFEERVKQEGRWIEYTEKDGGGFKRYQVLEAKGGNQYTVEYKENGGGVLTLSCIIKFAIEKREILKDGKKASIRVLRVLSYAFQ